ncbi:MAG: hypothetical protein SH821_12190 [Phototrophicales bacterium]|nr:hypothetical protein [Phototrophicales bacterium]
MSTPTITTKTLTVQITLSKKLARIITQEAPDKNMSVDTLISDYLEAYYEPEYEDTPDEQILADLREAFQDLKAGRVSSAREFLEELKKMDEEDD